ncbi:Chitin synthase regulator 2 [Podosphaera aphanis]|nr:Chitin synthase regulator 2 [Podosphaera aphanis]
MTSVISKPIARKPLSTSSSTFTSHPQDKGNLPDTKKLSIFPWTQLQKNSGRDTGDKKSQARPISRKSVPELSQLSEKHEPMPPVMQGIPHRSSYTRRKSEQIPTSKTATMQFSDSSGSSSPSGGSSSSSRPSIGRKHPERIDENDGIDGAGCEAAPVPPLHYFHQRNFSESCLTKSASTRDLGTSELPETRLLTPNMQKKTPNSIPRPMSTFSDMSRRSRSPGARISNSPRLGHRARSSHSRRSFDGRPISYVDLANTSYPQAPPAPISLDNSQLRSVVGSNASLLTTAKTIEMYRQNVKKLNDSETQYAFAIYLAQASQEFGLGNDPDAAPRKASQKSGRGDSDTSYMHHTVSSPQELLQEAKHILQKLANQSYPFAQYYLADGYATGLFNKGKGDYSSAFPLFIAASKHGHAESGYRAGLCYEYGWGCRKDPAKAVQFYRQSASKNHPGAMTRLGRACISGDLGMSKHREGLKWLKRATESADTQYNSAPYHLALLYETGFGEDIFRDEAYAAQLFTQAADLGHAEACFRLGDAYEHGKLSCPRDPALSVHFYTNAAQLGHASAMMALCAWYIVGAEPVLEKDESEAYEWARQAASCGLAKAEYAVGYFTEMGIGTRRDPLEANVWYVKAAESGDERAKLRLAAIRAAASGGKPNEVVSSRSNAKIRKKSNTGNEKINQNEKDCILM